MTPEMQKKMEELADSHYVFPESKDIYCAGFAEAAEIMQAKNIELLAIAGQEHMDRCLLQHEVASLKSEIKKLEAKLAMCKEQRDCAEFEASGSNATANIKEWNEEIEKAGL